MSIYHSLLQQCYQYLPSYVKVKHVQQCDRGALEFIFIISFLGYISPYPWESNECGRIKCLHTSNESSYDHTSQ